MRIQPNEYPLFESIVGIRNPVRDFGVQSLGTRDRIKIISDTFIKIMLQKVKKINMAMAPLLRKTQNKKLLFFYFFDILTLLPTSLVKLLPNITGLALSPSTCVGSSSIGVMVSDSVGLSTAIILAHEAGHT